MKSLKIKLEEISDKSPFTLISDALSPEKLFSTKIFALFGGCYKVKNFCELQVLKVLTEAFVVVVVCVVVVSAVVTGVVVVVVVVVVSYIEFILC